MGPAPDPPAPGDPGGSLEAAQLLPVVYDELKRLAESYLRRERRDHTLQATALVNEAYLRVRDRSAVDREHLLAIAAQAMRRVLVDHARHRKRQRRGGGAWQRVTLSEPVTPGGSAELDLVELDDVLDRLAQRDARAARIVELRFFGNLTVTEIARVLGISKRTVDNDWFTARAWLARALRAGDSA